MAESLDDSGDLLAFKVAQPGRLGHEIPPGAFDQTRRVRIGSLTGMQKEAVLTNSGTGDSGRIACDEGPFSHNTDLAPIPL